MKIFVKSSIINKLRGKRTNKNSEDLFGETLYEKFIPNKMHC